MADSAARKERRRKRNENNALGHTDEKSTGNFRVVTNEMRSTEKLFRRDTYVLTKNKTDMDVISKDDATEELNVSSFDGRPTTKHASETSVLTYNIEEPNHDTFNVEKPGTENRPVPAPRMTKSSMASEKLSSDTDRDVAEIDLDDIRVKSDSESKSTRPNTEPKEMVPSESEPSVVIPVPKPRKRVSVSQNNLVESPKPEAETEIPEPSEREDDCNKQGKETVPKKSELPLIENLEKEYVLKSEKEIRENLKTHKKLRIADLVEKKDGKKTKKPKGKKTGHVFSSIMKLEKAKIPKIASILKDLKDLETKEATEKVEAGEDNVDFQIDSPRYPESVHNQQIYVQNKNGFFVMEREDVLKSGSDGEKYSSNDRSMENSTVKTAIFFQKYWSRTMMYFHGILAGFAFGHTAMVTAIMMHFNYDPKSFIDLYSRLSLKIHYIFYSLTTFCIVSCFDRVDIGHINRKHWKTAWKVPSMWSILAIYIISFALTFTNHKTQARFDAYQYIQGNDTEDKIWNAQVPNEIQVGLLTWFHTIWARDALLLVAWLIISLTKFSDFLCGHLNNMVKYSEVTVDVKQ
ncbi:hypothetical protein RUM44_005041 [Polyplax serrata]|uniref:Uncharacterized protein n=1 Tax=Polyplax serrata TaxID=468196 RepID=A0ABR1AWS7_POLSC